jgi:uncharacterized protein (DUF952 family)
MSFIQDMDRQRKSATNGSTIRSSGRKRRHDRDSGQYTPQRVRVRLCGTSDIREVGGLIYHMLPQQDWSGRPQKASYEAESLPSEGFIHCSPDTQVLLAVANRFYQSQPGEWLILSIDDRALAAELRWETADGQMFPHVYGPLNTDSVVAVSRFPRDAEGRFLPPHLDRESSDGLNDAMSRGQA